MASSKEAYVGIDVAKLRNAVAIAESGRDGEIRYLGEFDASPESMKRLVRRLAAKHGQIHFCYEAGPTGYGLHRLITEMGHPCIVVAPSLIPRKASDRIKTNRRDAISLARLLRAGELTAVWVPNPAHEAMRNLVRSHTALVENIRAQKQQVSGFMLRHSRIFPRHKHWGARYWRGFGNNRSSIRPIKSYWASTSRRSGSPKNGSVGSKSRSPNSCPTGSWRGSWTRFRHCAASTSSPR